MASGLPYVDVSGWSGPGQPYGLALYAGMGLGALTAVLYGRRRGLSSEDLAVLLAAAVPAAFFAGHLADVAWYGDDDGGRWRRWTDGHALVGALAAVALVGLIVAVARRLDRGRVADVLAAGTAVAMAVGRIGCALVHDHLGRHTTSPLGVDVPRWRLPRELRDGREPELVRIHDVGLEELLVGIGLVIIAAVLARRDARPGRLALVLVTTYAVSRAALDLLRAPVSEPTRLGLTGGQWGAALALAVVGAVVVRRLARARA